MQPILLIEDEANIRKFISANLAIRGYKVIEVESAEAALAILHEQSPAAALLDIRLPGMDGWALLTEIASDPDIPNLPVVVVTGSLVHGTLETASYENLVDVLSKPIQVNNLLESVKQAVNRMPA